jgi:hypothetical protein
MNTISLQNFNVGNIQDQISNWSNSTTITSTNVNSASSAGITSGYIGLGGDVLTQNNSCNTLNTTTGTTYYWSYPYYPSTFITYSTDNTDKMVVTKAENGFVLNFKNKTYIAKTELELAKTIVKITTTDKK